MPARKESINSKRRYPPINELSTTRLQRELKIIIDWIQRFPDHSAARSMRQKRDYIKAVLSERGKF